MTSSRMMHLSDLYANALSEEFNSCMEGLERDNPQYQACGGFSSYLDCRCNFLKDVEQQCIASGERYVNHWYLQRHKRDSCKTTARASGVLSGQAEELNRSPGSDVVVNGIDGKLHPQERDQVQNSHKAYKDNKLTNSTAAHSCNVVVDKLHPYNTAFDTIGFRERYEKTSPNAMTIDCQFMRSLKATASPVENQMTTFPTTILFHNPTGIHTSSIEAIKVVPKGRNSLNEQ